MPVISGTTKALMVARLNVMRLGASRLDYHQPWLKFVINGVTQTGNVRVSGCTVQQSADGAAWSCNGRVSGFTPVPGQDIKVYLGDTSASHQLFGGTIIQVTALRDDGLSANLASYDIQCQDNSWALNKQKVMARWTSNSISTIVADVLSTWTLGFPGPHDIEQGLDTIDEFTATNEDVRDIFNRLAVRAGARCWVDVANVVHFTTQSGASTSNVNNTMAGYGTRNVHATSTILNRTTRVWSRGGGGNAMLQVPIGATSLPVSDGSWYPAAQDTQGGVGTQWTSMLESGTQRFNFGSTTQISANAQPATYLDSDHIAGDTEVYVNDLSVMPDFGWIAINNLIVRYNSRSGSVGSGYLQGIPATGYGSLLGFALFGSPVTLLSSLESTSSITEVIPAGQPISILYWVADIPAQTDFYGDLGAPSILYGRVDSFISDGRWGHETAKAEALGLLEQRKNNHEEVSFNTRDKTFVVGREVTFSLTNPTVSGTFKIQQVTISGLGESPTVFPMRSVTAASELFTMENIVKRIKNAEEKR